PAYAGGEAFPREVLLREADPPGERLVPWELPQDHAVRLDDVFRVSRHRDPSERPTALREEGPDEERDESLKGECVLDAGLFRLAADVVPVVEHDAPGPEEVEHRPDVDGDRLARATHVFLRILRAQRVCVSGSRRNASARTPRMSRRCPGRSLGIRCTTIRRPSFDHTS